MKEALVDVGVLLLFFNNADRFGKVFEQVRKARPSKLFLYQDGPRQGKNDEIGIEACRNIIDKGIDWECEVHKKYQTKNFGCDPSEYISQKWAFSYVDKCIVLEDDDVPSVSFFSFCKELLDRYENDFRVSMIAGLNHEEITIDCPYDYFFTRNMSIWGWASWKRVIDSWDEKYTFLEDKYYNKKVIEYIDVKKYRKDFYKMCERHKQSGIEYYESIFMSSIVLNSGLCIVPTRNMINNIGYTGGAVHYSSPIEEMPKDARKIFEMKRYELETPIKHPKYVFEDVSYSERVYLMMAWNHPWIKFQRRVEAFCIKMRRGNIKGIIVTIKKILHI